MRTFASALVLALLAALLAALPARAPAEAPAAEPAAVGHPAPFLWEVRGPKARHYLLGSVHLLPAAAHPLPAALDAAYDSTRLLVVETDLDALATPDVQGRMLGMAREDRPGGLEARLGKKLYGKLQKRAKQLGMQTPVCDQWRAWFCALALELYPLQQAQFSPAYGVDAHYFNLAREDGRPLASLETPEFQIALFAQMPEAQARQMLAATLDEATYEGQSPEELFRMWRTGDTGALEEMTRDLRKRYPDLHARLLADRNRSWVAPLAGHLKLEVPALVIVGAAHLPGADGLLSLLKAQGFEAKPVTAVPVEAPEGP